MGVDDRSEEIVHVSRLAWCLAIAQQSSSFSPSQTLILVSNVSTWSLFVSPTLFDMILEENVVTGRLLVTPCVEQRRV